MASPCLVGVHKWRIKGSYSFEKILLGQDWYAPPHQHLQKIPNETPENEKEGFWGMKPIEENYSLSQTQMITGGVNGLQVIGTTNVREQLSVIAKELCVGQLTEGAFSVFATRLQLFLRPQIHDLSMPMRSN